MATPNTSMSESSTSSRTTMPTRTTPSSRQLTSEIHRNTSRNRLSQCCMHVHQPVSQVCKPGESLALRKVKTPHNGKTSVSRFPLTKQDILLQYSSCFEGIGRFPGDPYKFHLKADHQPARHASKKQGISEEVNEHTDWVHSNIFVKKALEREPYHTHSTGEITKEFPNRERVEHARHFPTHMEMCMDDNLTLITERTQQQHFQDKTSEQSFSTNRPQKKSTALSHAEFPPGMEITPFFPGKQFLQGKEKFMDTGTFTLGTNMISTHNSTCIPMIVQPQDSLSNQLDQLKKSKMQGNRLTRLSHYINTGFPCDKKSLPRDLHKYWNDRDTLSINLKMDTNMSTNHMITIQQLMSEHFSDSISNRSAQPEENTTQKKYLTRLLDHNNIDLPCDKESSPTDLPESWSHKELLHNRFRLINQGYKIIPTTHKEVYLLSRPSKAMAHLY